MHALIPRILDFNAASNYKVLRYMSFRSWSDTFLDPFYSEFYANSEYAIYFKFTSIFWENIAAMKVWSKSQKWRFWDLDMVTVFFDPNQVYSVRFRAVIPCCNMDAPWCQYRGEIAWIVILPSFPTQFPTLFHSKIR